MRKLFFNISEIKKHKQYSQDGKGSSEDVRAELAVGHMGRGRRGLGRCVGVGGHSDWPAALGPAPSGLARGRCGRGELELSRAMLFVTAVLVWNVGKIAVIFLLCRTMKETERKVDSLIDTRVI